MKKLTKKFFCPVNGWDCPYHKDDWDGICCSLADKGEDPIIECDDVASFYDTPDGGSVWADDGGMTWDEQELLEQGYHFVNGEPVLGLEDTMKTVAEILQSPPMGMKTIEIRRPLAEGHSANGPGAR